MNRVTPSGQIAIHCPTCGHFLQNDLPTAAECQGRRCRHCKQRVVWSISRRGRALALHMHLAIGEDEALPVECAACRR